MRYRKEDAQLEARESVAIVLRDLRDCKVERVWKIQPRVRNGYSNNIWTTTHEVNFKKEEKLEDRNDEQRNGDAKQGKQHPRLILQF